MSTVPQYHEAFMLNDVNDLQVQLWNANNILSKLSEFKNYVYEERYDSPSLNNMSIICLSTGYANEKIVCGFAVLVQVRT